MPAQALLPSRPSLPLCATLLCAALSLATPPAQALSFRLTDLGPTAGFNPLYSAGRGLNEQGLVVGHIGDGGINAQAAWWQAPAVDGTARSAVYQAPPAGGSNGLLQAVNEGGQAVGAISGSGTGLRAVLRSSPTSTLLLPKASARSTGEQAFGINDAGVVVGQHQPDNYGFPLRWLPDGQGGYTVQALGGLGGGGIARDINNAGQIAGSSNVGTLLGATHAVRWQADGSVRDLGVLDAQRNFSEAYALNEAGTVVGRSFNGQGKYEAFRWAEGVMTGLGALDGWQGYAYLGTVVNLSVARDINRAGWIVGEALRADGQAPGFLYLPGVGMRDLNSLVAAGDPFFARSDVYAPLPGFRIEDAHAVNDAGQIVASAVFNHVYPNGAVRQATHAFLLTPDVAPAVPEPQTWALMVAGLLLLSGLARRSRV